VTVVDVLGKSVAVLVDGRRPAGLHSVAWDAGGQSNGVYFYKLEAGGFVETKSMLLAK